MKLLQINLDKLGITASVLCAIHCAIVPLTLTILPIWGMGFLANPMLEGGMIVCSVLIGIWSLLSSYRKHHQRLLPLVVLGIGFLIIALGHFLASDTLEPILVPIGGLTVAWAHYINIRLIKSCSVHHSH